MKRTENMIDKETYAWPAQVFIDTDYSELDWTKSSQKAHNFKSRRLTKPCVPAKEEINNIGS